MSEILTINEEVGLEGNFYYISESEIAYRRQGVNYSATIKLTEDPKIFEVLLNGKSHLVKIENALDGLIAEMGLNVLDVKDAGDIYSPMPGLVLNVLVKEGDLVDASQSVAVLEAMKMENIIKASGSGIISSISISQGDKVEKGQLLISIKPVE